MDLTLRRVAGAARRRGANLLARARPGSLSPAASMPRPVVGMVKQFSKRLVVGWISVPRDFPPVRVTLNLGKLEVASTYATPGSSMSGVRSALRQGGDMPGAGPPAPDSAGGAPLAHKWQLPNLPGPSDDRRNSPRSCVRFRCGSVTSGPTSRVDPDHRSCRRTPLPIYGHGMYVNPPHRGRKSVEALEEKLAEGYLFSQYGRLQLSKQLDTRLAGPVMRLYGRTRESFERRWATTPSSCTAPFSERCGSGATSATISTSTRRTSPGTPTVRPPVANCADRCDA